MQRAMNEREELAYLKAQQARLEQELGFVALRLSRLERRLNANAELEVRSPGDDLAEAQPSFAQLSRKAPALDPGSAPQALPSATPESAPAAEAIQVIQESTTASAPPRVPPIISEVQPAASSTEPVPVQASPTEPGRTPEALELRLGTYWAPRIGIVVLLTGLVFIGNLAYQRLGALGKVLLLYAASGVLLGAGTWWHRNAKETLKNYAQVLFAGGLAALYFTTYGAHHLENLRVVQSVLWDGVLLLGCAAFMVWTADRWRSEILAMFGVGLAYYTSIITRVGQFTLYSNLLLALAAIVFLVRNRWVTLSFGSVVGTYAAYVFWRFFNGSIWHWASPSEGLWSGVYFLFSYWAVFTAGVFLSREPKFASKNRASFLTLNNGAMFAMFVLTMLQVSTGGFWKFCLVYGGVLLVLAEAANRLLPDDPLAKDFYLTQGLLLVTVGFISRFAGLQLGLILAAESVVVLLMAYERRNLILHVAAYVVAALGVGWCIDGMRQQEPASGYLGCGLGALMLVNTLVANRRTTLPSNAVFRPQVSYFVVLALSAWWVTTWNQAARDQFPLILAAEGALFALSIYVLGIFELSFFGLLYLLIAQVTWAIAVFDPEFWPAGWNPLLMLSIALGMAWWWRRPGLSPLRNRTDDPWKALDLIPIAGKNLVLLAGAWLAARLAGGGDILGESGTHAGQFYLPIIIGALALADTLMAHRQQPLSASKPIRLQVFYSTAVALAIWLAVTWHHTERANFPLVLAGEGVLLTLSFYLLRVREVSILSQCYVILAQLGWAWIWLERTQHLPWWNPLLLVALTSFLSHWWQKQKALQLGARVLQFWQGLYALALVAILYFWFGQIVSPPHWLALTGLLAVCLTAYAVATRAWFVGACAQLFNLASLWEFASQLSQGHPSWHLALAPMGSMALLSWATERWFRERPHADAAVREPLLHLALLYRWVALAMGIAWVWQYVPARERIWTFSALGLAPFVFAAWKRSREALLFTAVFTVLALGLFWWPSPERIPVYWANLAAILLLLAEELAAKNLPDRFQFDARLHGPIIFIGGLSVWLFCTRWVMEVASGFYLTASWSLLALAFFTCGIVARERVYRWLGLGLLACALGRIVIFDVWKLETLYRILSFMALGVVLLVLGFVYSKYQEKIKEWL